MSPGQPPWLVVPDPDQPLTEAVREGLRTASTPTVMFASAPKRSLKSLNAHAERLRTQTGLDGAPFPLPALSGWRDDEVLAAYRGWLRDNREAAVIDRSSALETYLFLVALGPLAGGLHGLDVVDAGAAVRVTGTLRRGGTSGDSPANHTVTLHLRDAAGRRRIAVPTSPRLRFEGGALTWTGFVADLPLAQLPTGLLTFELDLEIPPEHGAALTVVANAADGLLATSRPVSSAGVTFQVLPARGSDRAEVLVVPARSRLRRRAATASRSARDVLRRRPYAWVSPLRAVTRPFIGRRSIWLVGERPDTARDNGYHLFAHLRRERPDIRAYYVIDRDSDQVAELSALGRVVAHSSWRHRFLMIHAAVLANAYSIKHMVPRQWDQAAHMRQLAWRTGAYRIYLKHGINLNTRDLRRRTGGYDLYLTSSAAETAASRETSGYDHQVVEAGLPRFDALVAAPPSRTILFMPTWRQYFLPRLFTADTSGQVEFAGSAYQRFVEGLLASPRLHEVLRRHDYRLEFMPHYNLREYLAEVPVTSDRITVLDGAASDIQQVMRRCDLFVTDHSSVHFDLAYLGTPLVYSHFDAEEYAAGHAAASWFDHERDGFGPVTYDLETTIDAVERYLAGGCVREELYEQRASAAFTHRDQGNSARVVAAIEHLVRTRGKR